MHQKLNLYRLYWISTPDEDHQITREVGLVTAQDMTAALNLLPPPHLSRSEIDGDDFPDALYCVDFIQYDEQLAECVTQWLWELPFITDEFTRAMLRDGILAKYSDLVAASRL